MSTENGCDASSMHIDLHFKYQQWKNTCEKSQAIQDTYNINKLYIIKPDIVLVTSKYVILYSSPLLLSVFL